PSQPWLRRPPRNSRGRGGAPGGRGPPGEGRRTRPSPRRSKLDRRGSGASDPEVRWAAWPPPCAARSVAAPRAAVGEGVAARRDELPGVSGLEERQLDDAVALAREYLAVRLPRKDRVRPHSARAHSELTDAVVRIGHAVGGLRREALVHFVECVEHDLGPGRVEIVPERLDRVIHGRRPRGRVVARDVPNGQCAQLGAVGQVGLEPRLLGGPGAYPDAISTGAVQHNDVPGTEVVAVVALPAIARRGAPIT